MSFFFVIVFLDRFFRASMEFGIKLQNAKGILLAGGTPSPPRGRSFKSEQFTEVELSLKKLKK